MPRTIPVVALACTLPFSACVDSGADSSDHSQSWKRGIVEGQIQHISHDACTEAVAWRWRDFHQDDTAHSDDLWVVAGFAIRRAELLAADVIAVEGSYGYLAAAATTQTDAGATLAQWDATFSTEGVLLPHQSEWEDPELAQYIAPAFDWPSGPHDGSDIAASWSGAFEAGTSYHESQYWLVRNVTNDVATRAWAFAAKKYAEGDSLLDPPFSHTPLRYRGGTGRAYKYCDLTGDQVFTNADGYRWCLPDCQLVLPDPAGDPGVPGPTPPDHLLRDSAGELLIPVCPDDFATDWAGGPPQLDLQ